VDDGQRRTGADLSPTLIWQAEPDLLVQVVAIDMADGPSVVHQVMTGLVEDPAETLVVPVKAVWLPAGIGAEPVIGVFGSRSNWRASVDYSSGHTDSGGHPAGSRVTISMGNAPDILSGDRFDVKGIRPEPTVVQGRPGGVYFGTFTLGYGPTGTLGWVETTMANGLHLHVELEARQPGPALTEADVMRVAEALAIDPTPDVSWLAD
jgi:hypothetical protein